MEQECSFLITGKEQELTSVENSGEERPYQIRRYEDSDFKDIARLLMNMYNDAWSEMFGPHVRMSLEEARKAVVTDLLVPDTRVMVLEHGLNRRLAGFISYAIRHGGVYFVEYEWVETEYSKYRYDDMLFQRVEDEAKAAGETSLHIRVSHRVRGSMSRTKIPHMDWQTTRKLPCWEARDIFGTNSTFTLSLRQNMKSSGLGIVGILTNEAHDPSTHYKTTVKLLAPELIKG